MTTDIGGLLSVKTIGGTPFYRKSDLDKAMIKDIDSDNGNLLTRKGKAVSQDLERAKKIIDEANANLVKSIDKLMALSEQASDQSRKVSGSVRKAADDLLGGLLKVEKQANFDRLEKYVGLLERAAGAMASLAELEKNGKLEKIAGALK